jgi:CDP-2,3-bis-(O-geranylgeranyl)-sn-glycerol synthase
LGPSKTWRGLLAALLSSSLAAPLLGFDWQLGLLLGSLAMLGDLFASFVKRRLGLAPSSQANGLDQIPESLFPMIYCWASLELAWSSLPLMVAIFWLSEVLLSRLLHRLGIRRHPY